MSLPGPHIFLTSTHRTRRSRSHSRSPSRCLRRSSHSPSSHSPSSARRKSAVLVIPTAGAAAALAPTVPDDVDGRHYCSQLRPGPPSRHHRPEGLTAQVEAPVMYLNPVTVEGKVVEEDITDIVLLGLGGPVPVIVQGFRGMPPDQERSRSIDHHPPELQQC
ncbi:hypothetical protein BDM02DRAFT_816697 [Thelephora ganbajun]|uniref:Uncharacterized protein n=1 Tax=Thelephora ganbajun TaxID=370292 RepID=A0ACB6Z5S3_THEGA|nr:hypothetical protein BDM02DRAFT_816697 [Thelephora ganbajun]